MKSYSFGEKPSTPHQNFLFNCIPNIEVKVDLTPQWWKSPLNLSGRNLQRNVELEKDNCIESHDQRQLKRQFSFGNFFFKPKMTSSYQTSLRKSLMFQQNESSEPSNQQLLSLSKPLPRLRKRKEVLPNLSPKLKKSRNRQRGLSIITQRLFQIVQRRKTVAYEKMVTCLLSQLDEHEFKGKIYEQNIRKRIQDALNGLIAVGLIKKQGNKIRIIDQECPKQQPSQQNIENISRLKKEIQIKSIILAQKQKQLNELCNQASIFKTWLQRNQNHSNKCQIIPFPFIGIISKVNDNRIQQLSTDRLQVFSKQRFELLGDIDIVKYLKDFSHISDDLKSLL